MGSLVDSKKDEERRTLERLEQHTICVERSLLQCVQEVQACCTTSPSQDLGEEEHKFCKMYLKRRSLYKEWR